MSSYDLSHIDDVGMEFSTGPSVSIPEMAAQALRQQYRVDSQLAYDRELESRWHESIRALQASGQSFGVPAIPLMYRDYARFVREGVPVTMPTTEGEGYGARINYDLQQPHPDFEEMQRANEAIRQLNNPEIKTFEQIMQEVSEMQRGIEEQTASMYERSGTFGIVGSLIGGAVGSFTLRDPLNIVTAPIGAGRTIFTRIGTDMLVAAGVVAATEFGDVQPNRALAQLPERDPWINIGLAAFGAGVIRGAFIEPAGYGLRRLREGRAAAQPNEFNLRDSLLQQMFESRPESPTARAGASILNDTLFIERNNPLGEGYAANERFIAELRSVHRAMNGEAMTAIDRVLPPLPFEYIQKTADFQIVREQNPIIYARMEAAQRRIDALNAVIEQRASLRDLGTLAESRRPLYERTDKGNVTEFPGTFIDPEVRGFHRSLTDEVRRRAQEARDAGMEYHRHGQLPFKIGDAIHTQKSEELGQEPWQVVGHFVDRKDPERYGYRVQRGTGEDQETSTLLVSDPRADARRIKTDPTWNRAEHVQGWRHVTDNPSEVVDFPGRMEETIQSRPGVNAGRMAKMLGPQLYGDVSDIGSVAIKEVLQNSFDAIKTALLRGLGKGKIDIRTNPETREIEIIDNGVGMTPETLGTKFLEIAGTGKEEGASSGGFGIAKMLFLYGNEDLRVITMRDGRVSEMVTKGEQLFRALEDPTVAPNIEVRDPTAADLKMFPDGSGTRIIMKIPKTYKDPKTGADLEIDFPRYDWDVPSLGKSPLFADIDVKFNRLDVDIGSKFPIDKYMPFSNIDFGWGNARIYVTREAETSYGDNVNILSNGIFQFSKTMKKEPLNPYSGNIPYQFYIDISPRVGPDEPGYPFNFNRQSFTDRANKDFGKILQYINALYAFDDLAKGAESFGNARYFDEQTGRLGDPINLKPTLKVVNKFANTIKPGDEMFVRDGRLYVNGRELPELKEDELKEGLPKAEELKVDPELIEPDRVMVHDNMRVTNTNGERVPFYDVLRAEFGERADEFLFGVGAIFKDLRNWVADVLDYPELRKEAVGVSFDPEYRGVSIRVPFSGSFINPFLPESADIIEAAYGTFGTMIHELAHYKVRSHNERFPQEMQRIWYKLQANTDNDFVGMQHDLIAAFQDNQEVFRRGKELLEGSDAELAGNRLGGVTEDPNAPGRDDRLLEGADSGGPEGVGPGGVPAEAQRGIGPTQLRRQFGRDDFGPEADAAVREQLRLANEEYAKAYKEVEAEAARLREEQGRAEAAQQKEASNILAQVSQGRPFVGPLLRYDNVESLVERINAINDTLDEKSVARFVREAAGEGEEVAPVTWRTEDGRIDIGLKEPIDPEFRVVTDEGETSVAEVMRDLQEDADLVEAIKGCAI